MAAEREPPHRPLHTASDVVGPDDAREDVSSYTDRGVAVRALDVMLHTREEVRMIRAGFHLETDAIKGRLAELEAARSPPPPDSDETTQPMRDKDASFHDFDHELKALRSSLRDKVVSRHHPISESSALALIRGERERVETLTELGTWRAIKRFFLTSVGKVVDRSTMILVSIVVGWLIHHFLTK